MFEMFEKLKNGVFTQIVDQFSAAIPKVAMTFFVLLIGWMLSRLVRRILERVIATLGVDKLTERLNDIDLVQRTGANIKISSLIGSAAYYFMMLSFLILATDILGIQAITDMVRDLVQYLPVLFSALAFLMLGLFLADMLRNALQTTLQSMGISSAKLIATGVFYFIFVSVAISALAQAKISTGFIASNLTVLVGAGAAAFALGYGLASRDLVANYLAGYYNRNKIRIGDDVRIEGERGKVVMIDSTTMILQTQERAILVPLSKLTTEKVEVFYPDPSSDNLVEAGKTKV